MTKYNVYVFSDKEEITTVERELPEPQGQQVLIRVRATAICTLEQRVYSGKMPRYPFAGGHEVAGEVFKVGEGVKTVKPGDRVAPRMLTSCGLCHYCRTGNEHQCVVSFKTEAHKDLMGPGGFSDFMLVDEKNVYKMNPELDFKHIALTEPLACCVHSICRGDIQLGDDVVVIGVGIMGAFHIMLAKLRGARVIALEVDDARLEFAKKLGADVVINSGVGDPVGKVKEICTSDGAQVVFVTTAIPDVAEQAVGMVDKMGKVIFYSSFHPNKPINVDPNAIHSRETVITGTVNPGIKDFYAASRLLSNGSINANLVISEVYDMEELDQAVKQALRPDTYRVIVQNR